MAANEVKLTIKVGDNGSLDVVAKKAKKAAKETEEVGKATDKTTKSRNRFNKGEKGVAGATNNSTKAFSKMRDSMTGGGGLVPAYATLAANVFALSAAFGVLQRAAQLEQLKQGFEVLANTAGRSANVIVSSIQQITDGAVSADSAFRTAAAGFNAGFSSLEIERLTKIAKTASQALGRNLTDSLDRLIRGTAKLEPEILDELGIFIRLDDAVKTYAENLNKTAGELTQAERRQAFLNSALEQGELKFGGLGDSIPANPFDKLAANFDKISKTFLTIVSTILGPVISVLANSTIALVGVLILFGNTITSQIFPVLENLGGKYATASQAAQKSAEDQVQAQKKLIKNSKKQFKETSPLNEKSRFALIQKKIRAKEKVDLAELKIAQDSLALSEEKRALNLSKYEGEILAKKQAELNLVRQQKVAVENLIAAEKGRGKFQVGASRAGRLKDLEQGVSDSVADIQNAGTLEGFKKARQGLKEYREDKVTLVRTTESFRTGNKKLDRMLKKIAISFRVGGVAARLFGTALINAIPVIGQIIFVLGLVISAFTSLAKSVFGPTEAMQKFNEVVSSSADKIKQLDEANDKLESKYYGVLISQEQAKKGVEKLTIARLEEIKATAENFANVEKYANTLKVTSGIVGEFADAVDGLAAEMRKEEEPGFLQSLVSYTTGGVFSAVQAAIRGIKSAFIALKEVLTDNIITKAFGMAVEALGTLGKKLFPELARGIDIAPVLNKTETFKSEVLNQFKELEQNAPAAAKAITDSLGVSFSDFVEQQFVGIDAAEDYNAAQKAFERGSIAVAGVLKKGAVETKKASDAIFNFGENVREAGTGLASFRNKFFKQGEFGDLAAKIKNTALEINNLRDATEREGSTTTFADALALKIKQGEINLGDYGVSFEEVKEKGGDAFANLINKFTSLDVKTREYKQSVSRLKAELANIDQIAAFEKIDNEVLDILEGLRETGTAAQLAGRGLKELTNVQARAKQDAKDRDKNRKELIDLEIDLELLKLEVLSATTKLNDDQIKLVEKLRRNLESSRESRKSASGVQSETDERQSDADFLKSGEMLRNKLRSIAKTGDTTAERLAGLGTQFEILGSKGLDSFAILDEAGNVIGDNFTARIEAVTSALQPLIQAFADLGPEGKVAQAFAQGMVMMAESAARLGDTIQSALGQKATESFENFTTSFEAASFADKARVAAAAFALAANSIAGLASALKEQSNAAISKIDEQIEREKKLDGKSAQSAAKIRKLEADKEKIKRKAFETDKKLRVAQAIMSTAAGVASALTLPPPLGFIMAGLVAAMGAAQIGIISGLSYQGGASGAPEAPTSVSVGKRSSSIDMAKSQGGAGELAYMRGGRGQGGPENFTPAFAGYKNRAEGGNTAFMVGEQGPELFVPERPGRIVPNDDIQQGTPVNATINISAVDAAGVEDVLMNQRGNIISMIRDAANAQGNTFLEEINVAEL